MLKLLIRLERLKIWIRRFFGALRGFFPSALPVGMTQFNKWADSVVSTYQLPDNDSSRFALASMIMHLGPTRAFQPKRYFGLSALKGMSNQVAHQVLMDLKAKQKAEQELEAKKLEDENKRAATAQEVASDEPLSVEKVPEPQKEMVPQAGSVGV